MNANQWTCRDHGFNIFRSFGHEHSDFWVQAGYHRFNDTTECNFKYSGVDEVHIKEKIMMAMNGSGSTKDHLMRWRDQEYCIHKHVLCLYGGRSHVL